MQEQEKVQRGRLEGNWDMVNKKKGSKKKVSEGIAHIHASFNNTLHFKCEWTHYYIKK